MDYADLLSGFQTQAQQQNPFYSFGAQVMQGPSWGAGFDDPWSALAAGLGQGLVGGAAASYGQSQVQPQVSAFNDYFMNAISNPTQQVPDLLQDDPYTQQVQAALLMNEQANRAKLQQAQAQKIQDANMDIQKEFAKNQNEQYGVEEPTLLAADGTVRAPVAKPNTRLISDDPNKNTLGRTTASVFPGGMSLEERERQITADNLAAGYPPVQAASSAKSAVAQERKLIYDQLEDLRKVRENAAGLQSIAERAKVEIPLAGQTGGTYAPGGLGDKLSYLYSAFSGDEAQQRAATAALDKMKQEVIQRSRVPGVGAASDFETRAMIGAGVSSELTPEQNKKVVTRMEKLGQFEQEYVDFMENYAYATGNLRGADQLWNAFKKENPLVIRGEDGNYVYNEDRKTWRQKINEQPTYLRELGQKLQSGQLDSVNPGYQDSKTETTENFTIKQARDPDGNLRKVRVNSSGQIVGVVE